jgi:radical SAM modification target selenobiotic family peptide
MDTNKLKVILAGVSIAGLVAGAAVTTGCNSGDSG